MLNLNVWKVNGHEDWNRGEKEIVGNFVLEFSKMISSFFFFSNLKEEWTFEESEKYFKKKRKWKSWGIEEMLNLNIWKVKKNSTEILWRIWNCSTRSICGYPWPGTGKCDKSGNVERIFLREFIRVPAKALKFNQTRQFIASYRKVIRHRILYIIQ